MRPMGFKLLVAIVILAISGWATAQDVQGDPPSRVLRLQYIDGPVSLQPGGVDDWVAANLNRPLTTADRIWADRGSKVELTMASAALRLGSETSVTITNLDDNTAQIELDQGTLNLSVRYLNQGEIIEVDTPNFAYTIETPGEYRFDVIPQEDQSWVTVRRGDGEATGEGNAVRVREGQQFRFSSGQTLSYTSSRVPPRDGFDDWCEVRERREVSSDSARYVAAGTIGYEDLDDNGYWTSTPTYGTVWYPRVHPGWAPYREGHWAWVEPWGWTWVDDAPWGFAPFHYGRWVHTGNRWGWIPGPMGVRPVYAPALVGWVGGSNWGVSVGFGGGGGVGWFPLGWHDPYFPSYHASRRYAREVNVTNSRMVNVTTINNYYGTYSGRNANVRNIQYENAKVNGAVTGVPSRAFAAGRPVKGNAVVVPANAVARANVMTTATVVPTKEAVLGGHPPAPAPQHVRAPRQVISKTPPPPRPVKFDQQRPLLEKNNGVPLSPQVRSTLQKSNAPQAPRGGQPQAGKPPTATQPTPTQPAASRPVAPQPAGQGHFGRQPAANVPRAPQPGVRTQEQMGGAPEHNVPRPPQAGGPVSAPRAPVTTREGHAPVTQPNKPAPEWSAPARPSAQPVPRETVPSRPSAPSAPRETAPSRPSAPSAPRETAPSRPSAPSAPRETAPSRPSAPSAPRETAPSRPSAPPAPRETAPSRPSAPAAPRETAPSRPSAPPVPREAAPSRSWPQPVPRETAPARPSAPPVPREAVPARPSAQPVWHETAPARPSAPPVPRETAPAHPVPQPAPHQAAPAQHQNNAPPARESKPKKD